ncbi:WXG100 family type VII secretion target [Streptomyces sp. NBC_01497]|uniref:WXG100 family type VII secretion target n=1 Tax=Streptomyces sp. NBC_01497 TaxID=2903885 RepID=UPI002E353BAE|nr:WXG100 family type VII secretion target [Streptomyces sp. NBC_01497]
MANNTAVDLDGMKAAQGTFQTALDETTSSYSQMDGQIEGLRSSWTGQASTIYGSAMEKWLEDFNVVNNALRTMLEKLQSNTGVYANTHEDTQQQANQVQQLISSGNFSGLAGFPS